MAWVRAIEKAEALVMKLNEDDVERMRADSRWKRQVDQAARERHRYRKGLAKGRKEAEAKYRPTLEEKDREIEELRRKLREAGIEG
jgi:predicted RNase H-like nuclease (RuvC/YqgF family)